MRKVKAVSIPLICNNRTAWFCGGLTPGGIGGKERLSQMKGRDIDELIAVLWACSTCILYKSFTTSSMAQHNRFSSIKRYDRADYEKWFADYNGRFPSHHPGPLDSRSVVPSWSLKFLRNSSEGVCGWSKRQVHPHRTRTAGTLMKMPCPIAFHLSFFDILWPAGLILEA